MPKPLKTRGGAERVTLAVLGATVLVERKRQKNMYLSVLPDGGIRVTCPVSARDGDVAAFVASHADWLRARLAEVRARRESEKRLLLTGDAIPLWGRPRALVVRPGRPWGVELDGETLVMTAPDRSAKEEREILLGRFYSAQMEEAAPPLLRRWRDFLGVRPAGFAVRRMTSRWGSCSARTGRISLNLRLAEKDPRCLEYVVVHELCHLLAPDHSPAFWSHVARCLPGWRELRALTRDGG